MYMYCIRTHTVYAMLQDIITPIICCHALQFVLQIHHLVQYTLFLCCTCSVVHWSYLPDLAQALDDVMPVCKAY